MKRVILVVVVVAVAAFIAVKLISRTRLETQPQPVAQTTTNPPSSNQTSAQSRPIFYLFHDPSDQDEECRRIYAFANRAERELGGRVDVRRPDVERDRTVVEQYQVRVLPTILLVSANGTVEERFEGEDKETVTRIEQTLARLKGQWH
jgi:thioredoxin-like negative regulator of GroEL